MRMSSWLTAMRPVHFTLAFVAILNACASGGEVGTSAGTGTSGDTSSTTSTSIPTTGYEPDDELCVSAKVCDLGSDCCEHCPSVDYPFNWACDNGECVHGGCTDDLDCTNLFAGWECHSISGVSLCVAPCDDDTDGDAECSDVRGLPGTSCVGVSLQGNFCQENVSTL